MLIASTCYTQNSTIIHRSEFEKVGDLIYDVQDSNEGISQYSIQSGNTSGNFTIDESSGQITIAVEITDVMGTVKKDSLVINIESVNYKFLIVDGYDYFIDTHPELIVLNQHQQTDSTINNPYTAYNNVWGKGNAVLNQDFRMSTLSHKNLPDSTVFIWDTPSKASTYGGASVWSYSSLIWGNRKNQREDLLGFPFQISSISNLIMNFDFEQLYGTKTYKVALNHFLTDEFDIQPFSENDGDFFMVFDQVGTWIPPYTNNIGDTTMYGKEFTRLHKQDNGYDYRRIIIKDNGQLTTGTLDLKVFYDNFKRYEYMNFDQYIPNIQFGIEVTEGFGALRVNKWEMTLNDQITSIDAKTNGKLVVYPNPTTGRLIIPKAMNWTLRDSNGSIVLSGNNQSIDISELSKGFYIFIADDNFCKVILN